MSDRRRILVVDDQYEVQEFLRSLLAEAEAGYEVLTVPSAEEGFLELQRVPFNLLITDLRLPGMSGLELARKVQNVRPTMPVIVMTAHTSETFREQAAELGVLRYFEKPFAADEMMAAVRAALSTEWGKPASRPEAEDAGGVPGIGRDVRQRLHMLSNDTGAFQVMLADSKGKILHVIGGQPAEKFEKIAVTLADSLRVAARLAQQLGTKRPLTIQYQAGQEVDLYCANIDHRYMLLLLFAAGARRGRIGTVWVFAQRAIKDLQAILEPAPDESLQQDSDAETLRSEPAETTPSATLMDGSPPTRDTEESALVHPGLEALPDEDVEPELAWLLEMEEAAETVDVEAFWNDALTEAGGAGSDSGLSFEEAVEQGLLPPDFTREDEGD
jgi:DNA-binding response OmpR family regulator